MEYVYDYITTGNLSYEDFTSSFNGHIPLFPKLITFPYFYINSFDIGNLYYLQWIIMSLSLYFVYLLLKKTNRLYWSLIPISAFIYNPLITHGYYVIPTLQWQIPSLGVLIITYLFNREKICWKVFSVASTIASLSTFTFIIGITTWLPGIVYFTVNHSKKYWNLRSKWLVVWIIITIIIGLTYYSLVPKSDIIFTPEIILTFKGFSFLTTFLASSFRLKYDFLLIFVGTATIFLSLFFALHYIKIKKFTSSLPWFILILISFISAIITTIGRASLDQSGYRPDYIMWSYLTQIGLVVLSSLFIHDLFNTQYKKYKLVFLILIIVTQMMLLVPSYYSGWIRGDHYYQQKLEYVECYSLSHDSNCLGPHSHGASPAFERDINYSMLNYWLRNKLSIFGDPNFNQQNREEIEKFNQIWTDKNKIYFGFGKIEKINNVVLNSNTINIDSEVILINGWIVDHEKKQLNSIYLLIDDKPLLKYDDFLSLDDVKNLNLDKAINAGWKISLLSGYIEEGCHKISIAGLSDGKKILLEQEIELCK